MNIKYTAAVAAISFFSLAGGAMAEAQPAQQLDTTILVHTGKSAEFAAYEFKTDSDKNNVETLAINKTSSEDEVDVWYPYDWSETP